MNVKENLYVGNKLKRNSKEEEKSRGAVTEVIDLDNRSEFFICLNK